MARPIPTLANKAADGAVAGDMAASSPDGLAEAAAQSFVQRDVRGSGCRDGRGRSPKMLTRKRPPTEAGSGEGQSGPLTRTGTASPSGPLGKCSNDDNRQIARR